MISTVFNVVKTLVIMFIILLAMIVAFYTSYLAIPFLIVTISGILIFSYLKVK